jgi:hypothetical protein
MQAASVFVTLMSISALVYLAALLGAFPFVPSVNLKESSAAAHMAVAVVVAGATCAVAMLIGWSFWPLFWFALAVGALVVWARKGLPLYERWQKFRADRIRYGRREEP